MIKITPKDKAFDLFKKFRTQIIDSPKDGINNEVATVCALIHVTEMQKEFEHYFGSEPKTEVRPFDLSGKEFWEQTKQELQKIHETNYIQETHFLEIERNGKTITISGKSIGECNEKRKQLYPDWKVISEL